MKYVIFLGDGMADHPVKELNNKTPLETANKPNIDKLAGQGILGMVKSVPDHYKNPGSDVANMSILGYDPDRFYTGRSPLEAVSMGIQMIETDLAVRCNLVTLSDDEIYEEKTMIDYSSDEVSTEEAAELINYVNEKLGNDALILYPGVSYRHCLLWQNGIKGIEATPPHDISGKKITTFLPKAQHSQFMTALMKESYTLLKDHPVNRARLERGLNPANSIWLWGEGTKPGLASFEKLHNKKGAIISAVDLLKGIAICAGMDAINVPGATGNIHTNFEGKAQAAIDYLKSGGDFVYIHVEAADECGHRYEIENKVRAIELFDEKVVGPVMTYLQEQGDFKVLVLPDHPTPLDLRTHTNEPVPFVLYDSGNIQAGNQSYNEINARNSGIYVEPGFTLINKLFE